MATHTHSGPGGCAYEALYNMPTPGFVPEHVEAVVNAVMLSISNALDTEKKLNFVIKVANSLMIFQWHGIDHCRHIIVTPM